MKVLKFHLRKVHHFFKSFLFQAVPAAIYFGFPGKKMQIYGITGTDGKTTSSTMLYHVLKNAGYKVALISTVAAFIGDEEIDTGFHVTSPEPWEIQKLLARCVEAGIEHVVLEVTSHGIFQYRVWGIDFVYSGMTNISHEHLDYFVDYQRLLATKSQLLLSAKKTAFLNKDDQSFAPLKAIFDAKGKSFTTYSQKPREDVIGRALRKRFFEEYNRWNGSLVAAMAQVIGVSAEKIAEAVETFPGVRGRMEVIPDPKGRLIIVDFAHTPRALESILTALRAQSQGKLIAVFGCAGLRDVAKRPLMGGVAARLADLSIFTSEDPRTEDVELIFRQMKEGVGLTDHGKVITVKDRRSALALALSQSKKVDVIGVFGKGHEKTMCFGTTETPWSDQEALSELLARKAV